jgi:hypothetical protein
MEFLDQLRDYKLFWFLERGVTNLECYYEIRCVSAPVQGHRNALKVVYRHTTHTVSPLQYASAFPDVNYGRM